MKPKPQHVNRIHSATQWPLDTLKMAALAKTDLDFVEIMNASRINSPELRKIAQVAKERLDWAVSKLKDNPK